MMIMIMIMDTKNLFRERSVSNQKGAGFFFLNMSRAQILVKKKYIDRGPYMKEKESPAQLTATPVMVFSEHNKISRLRFD